MSSSLTMVASLLSATPLRLLRSSVSVSSLSWKVSEVGSPMKSHSPVRLDLLHPCSHLQLVLSCSMMLTDPTEGLVCLAASSTQASSKVSLTLSLCSSVTSPVKG